MKQHWLYNSNIGSTNSERYICNSVTAKNGFEALQLFKEINLNLTGQKINILLPALSDSGYQKWMHTP